LKITKSQLKQIIKEELKNILAEEETFEEGFPAGRYSVIKMYDDPDKKPEVVSQNISCQAAQKKRNELNKNAPPGVTYRMKPGGRCN